MRKELFINERTTIKDALKQLDKSAEKVLLVIDNEEKLLGTLTDGDIRRYILKGKSLDSNIEELYHRNPLYIKKDEFSFYLARKMLLEHKVELVPLVDDTHKVIDFITWSQAFRGEVPYISPKEKIDVPLVIMAGGKGTRMDPFTRILPKPLIPVGDKPIIEIIIDEFRRQGIIHYFLTLNYKGEMIEAYFQNMKKEYTLDFIKESEYRGTAGGLKHLSGKIEDTFIVSNCDVIVHADFGEVVNLHKKQNATLTILSSIQYHKIPYGVIEFKEEGEVVDICEKPEYTITANTGVYVMSKGTLEFIPEKGIFDMTDLIKKLIEHNRRVITYPVNQSDYIDIGQWEEYRKALDKLDIFR